MRRIKRQDTGRIGVFGAALASIAMAVGLIVVSAGPAMAQSVVAVATAVIPGGPGSATCSTNLDAANQSTDTVDGIQLTGLAGSCNSKQAQASVSVAQFGNGILVESMSSMCVVGQNKATSSAVYKGMVITTEETIHVGGYTLLFNAPATSGGLNGLTALTITTPSGAVVKLATTYCAAPYPLLVTPVNGARAPSAAKRSGLASGQAKATVNGRRAGFSSTTPKDSSSSLPTIAVLGLAICAFVAVNVFGVMTFRRRQRRAS